jgi:predicted DNA-binding protein
MAMNLRLPDALAEALRALAERTGRSQQDLVRAAVDSYVRDYDLTMYPAHIRAAVRPGRRSGVLPTAPRPATGHDPGAVLGELRAERL